MARKKAADKKKSRIVSGPTAPGVARSLGEALGRTLRPLAPLAFLAVLYAGTAYLLWLPAKHDPQAVLTKARLQKPILRAEARPVWLPDREAANLVRVPLHLEGRSVFEPGLATELGRLYESNPWVARVGTVKVRYPAALQVEDWSLRAPFARVELQAGYVVVDRTGCVLPMRAGDLAVRADLREQDVAVHLPSLVAARAEPAAPGRRLAGQDVQDGLDLLAACQEVLARLPNERHATRVVGDAQSRWRVWLDTGAVVEWGYWPEEARPEGEPSRREKLDTLARRLFEWDRLPFRYIKLQQPNAPVMPR
ncbi:MAG: cell division protein FtsQ/DivIB [Planctomycetota bacterium]|nr:cell division protein FtsQ/DivIB [Planctomycetota bacterium]